MSDNCIFCKIIRGEIPSTLLYQDDQVVAFRDINPQAPVHILIVPRQHVVNVSALDDGAVLAAGRMLLAAKAIAASENVADGGYRLIINSGENGGQEVLHLHMHLLGGRRLGPMLSKQT
jgi:histidine triad (HIT) family protein